LVVEYNPEEDPEFRGSLNVELRGLDSVGSTLFSTHVFLTISEEGDSSR
jgi:hypothetical protein